MGISMGNDLKTSEAIDVALWPHELRVSDPAFHPFWLRWLNTFINVSTNILKYIAIGCFIILLADVFTGVVFRYVFNSPLTWSESLALWFLIWLSFAGAPYPLNEGTHFVVEYFVKVLPRRIQIWVAILIYILILGFCIVILKAGIWLTIENIQQISPAIYVPYAIPYSSIPIGFFIISLIIIRDLIELLLNFFYKMD